MKYELFKLNFPVTTDEARKFWASQHKLNRVKAIIAFSLSESNANDNLRREGFPRGFRELAVVKYKNYIGQHDMKNVPFSALSDLWYKEITHNA